MPDAPEPTSAFLNFCTRCGAKVSPYAASLLSLRLTDEHGHEPPEPLLMAQPHYWCGECREHWLATNLLDTGMTCACGNLVPLNNKYCGACGVRART